MNYGQIVGNSRQLCFISQMVWIQFHCVIWLLNVWIHFCLDEEYIYLHSLLLEVWHATAELSSTLMAFILLQMIYWGHGLWLTCNSYAKGRTFSRFWGMDHNKIPDYSENKIDHTTRYLNVQKIKCIMQQTRLQWSHNTISLVAAGFNKTSPKKKMGTQKRSYY
jgi:hypothetical protein